VLAALGFSSRFIPSAFTYESKYRTLCSSNYTAKHKDCAECPIDTGVNKPLKHTAMTNLEKAKLQLYLELIRIPIDIITDDEVDIMYLLAKDDTIQLKLELSINP
jgi:hypothetical protein